MRAIETARVMLRATNTGVTAIIDIVDKKRIIKRRVDVLGKEVNVDIRAPILYIYDDGKVEKRIVID